MWPESKGQANNSWARKSIKAYGLFFSVFYIPSIFRAVSATRVDSAFGELIQFSVGILEREKHSPKLKEECVNMLPNGERAHRSWIVISISSIEPLASAQQHSFALSQRHYLQLFKEFSTIHSRRIYVTEPSSEHTILSLFSVECAGIPPTRMPWVGVMARTCVGRKRRRQWKSRRKSGKIKWITNPTPSIKTAIENFAFLLHLAPSAKAFSLPHSRHSSLAN